MKIIPLIENNYSSDKLLSEHGLSIYIEKDNHKIIFDTGQSDSFIKNAKQLDIDLTDIDIVVISHSHYDHTGGLIPFLELNKKAKVYLKKEIFDYEYYSIRGKQKKKIGCPLELKNYEDRLVFLETAFLMFDNLIFITNFDKNYSSPKGNKILFKEKDNKIEADDFKHELIFATKSKNGLCVFSGCAHNGILNVVSTVQRFLPNFPIWTVIGGFHLIDKNDFVETETNEEIISIAKELKKLNDKTTYYTGHCTCNRAFDIMAGVLKHQLSNLKIGEECHCNYYN